MPFCVKCATPLPDDGRYCTKCGTDNSGDTGQSIPALVSTPDPDLEERLRQELRDQYVIERELGRGGMGAVFLATEQRLGRRVAIKILPPSVAFGAVAVERFLREARTSATLDHPHIIPVYRVSEAGQLHWFSMKYVEGHSLGELLESKGAMPFEQAADIVGQVAEALVYAHRQGVVHRDVKPGNMMIASNGWVTVTDFGIAKAAGTQSITGSGSMLGTPYYMSPEQCAGKVLGPAADQYSLAVVAFQMLAGRLPFVGEAAVDIIKQHCFDPAPSVAEFRKDVPPALAAVVARGMAKAPKDRFADVEAFADAFGRAARGEPISDAFPEPQPTPRRRVPAFAWGSVALALVVVGYFVWPTGAKPPSRPPLADTGARNTTAPLPAPPTPNPAPVRRDSGRAAAPPKANQPVQQESPTGELGFLTVGSNPAQARLSINGKPTSTNPVFDFQVPAGTVRLHFDVTDSLGAWSYDTTVAVAPREHRKILRISLVRK